jgi:Txe/YoeB family toxin of Txe-Axe toxin-antitoxin module
MKINVPQTKKIVYPLRFDVETWEKLKEIAKKNKTQTSKVIYSILKEALADSYQPKQKVIK